MSWRVSSYILARRLGIYQDGDFVAVEAEAPQHREVYRPSYMNDHEARVASIHRDQCHQLVSPQAGIAHHDPSVKNTRILSQMSIAVRAGLLLLSL